jgi:hypothetical protein
MIVVAAALIVVRITWAVMYAIASRHDKSNAD